jgi:hypothetical protein
LRYSRTLPDEVAHTRFDTPRQGRRRDRAADLAPRARSRTAWDAILAAGAQAARTVRLTVERSEAGIRADAREQPMAITVIGRLITSTLLSLLVVPVMFMYVDGFERSFKRRFAKKPGRVPSLSNTPLLDDAVK